MVIEVTRGQYEYAAALSGGAKTTRDLANHFCVCLGFASKVMLALRKAGVVKSTRMKGVHGKVYQHELIVSLDLLIAHGPGYRIDQIQITDDEVRYAAELRNDGLIGQRLTTEYQKRYSYRKHATILKNIVPKAVARGLCL